MEILRTWVFTYDQFKDIPFLVDIIGQKRENPRPDQGEYEVHITVNNWPVFRMVKIYEVMNVSIESLEPEYYLERPYYKRSYGNGSTTYPQQLLKIDKIEELKSILLIK
jgi:hypothetical protein